MSGACETLASCIPARGIIDPYSAEDITIDHPGESDVVLAISRDT